MRLFLKLSGHNTWNSSPLYNIPFRECSKWYFIKGVRLLSIHCKEHLAAYCLWVKTCKRYFKSALSIKDEYSESIHDACHVYLAALYYVSGTNQEKTTKHLLNAENGTSTRSFLKPQILSYSSLRFVDTVTHVCGFHFLFNHVLKNQNKSSESGFTLSAIVQCMITSVSRISNTNPSNKLDRKETKHNFTSLFDIFLWAAAVSVHKYRQTAQSANREIHKSSPNIQNNNLLSDEGDIQFCLEDSLEETLVKISVEMFTKYREMQFTTMPQIGVPVSLQDSFTLQSAILLQNRRVRETIEHVRFNHFKRNIFVLPGGQKTSEVPPWLACSGRVLCFSHVAFSNNVRE